jgi:hypothetical protein
METPPFFRWVLVIKKAYSPTDYWVLRPLDLLTDYYNRIGLYNDQSAVLRLS